MHSKKHLIRLLISNPRDRELLKKFLNDLGHEVNDSTELSNEDGAAISALIVDADLARKNLKNLLYLKQNSGPAFLPIIILLAKNAESFIWLENGFDEALRLPLIKGELTARLTTLLKLREETESQFNLIYKNMHLGVYRMTADLNVIHANPAFLKILGFKSISDILNKNLLEINPTQRKENEAYFTQVKNSEKVIERQFSLTHQDGSEIHVKESAFLFEKNLEKPYYVGIIEDTTEYKKIENELKYSEEKFRKLVDLSPYGIIIETEGVITFANKAALKIFKARQEDQLVDSPLLARVPEQHQEVLKNRLKFVKEHQISTDLIEDKFLDLDENILDLEVIVLPFNYKEKKATQIILNDITDRNHYENKILQMAYYDPLTGLSNRIKIDQELNREILLHKDNGKFISLLLLDIDDFKKINDTFGHDVGDLLLKEFAIRLKRFDNKNTIISRIGGDEFIMTILHMTKPDVETDKLCHNLITALNEPFILHNTRFFVTASIGISIYPTNGISSRILFKNADIAMYAAKKNGGNNHQFCTPALTLASDTKTYLEIELREAIANNKLFLHYQPKLSLASGRVIGAEALLRWEHPLKGKISPITFIPLAESTGLITDMTKMALRQVCQQIKIWKDTPLKDIHISINLSARDFRNQNLEKEIYEIIHQYQIEPKLIEFEITESILMEDMQRTVQAICYFKKLGIRVSIDDFGTGYSSLSYIKKLQCDSLKIDQSFIRDIYPEALDSSMVISIIAMAHSMNMEVIAEGVETIYQYHFLKENHCSQIQGYLLSQPLAADDFSSFILNLPASFNIKKPQLV